jgi:riboflavin kinase/FMN adenylyltransferase
MQIIYDYLNCPKEAAASVVTLGNFDGIHKGHKAIISEAGKIARAIGAPLSVMTFEPHPISVFRPGADNFRLTNLEQKTKLLQQLGSDFLFVVNFDLNFSKITADLFIKDILAKSLKVRHIVIGYDFIFGFNKEGNATLLDAYKDEFNYGFTQIQAVGDEEIYSSTKIRKNLTNGQLQNAAHMLDRNYSVSGRVIKGDNRGHAIGFPTINLDTGFFLRPKDGVYAVKVRIDDDNNKLNAVANIGTKPTFSGKKQELEVHIFDFNQNIYGHNVEVEFIQYIRNEIKFTNVDNLVAQIKEDCKIAYNILNK